MTVRADGLPLEVVGCVSIPVSLGKFQADQEFTVVNSLTVDRILGANFLVKHGAVIDCKTNVLYLGGGLPVTGTNLNEAGYTSAKDATEDAVALVSEAMELPGRSISFVSAHVPADCHQEGLVEPRGVCELAKHLLLPRTLV